VSLVSLNPLHDTLSIHQGILEDIARHIAEHGDWTIANTAIERMNAEERNLTHEAAGAVKWLVKYVGLIHDKEEFTGWNKAQFIKDNFSEGHKNPYWSKITIAKPFEFNLDSEIAKLVSRANSAMKKAKTAEDNSIESDVVVNIDHLTALKAIAA